MHFGVNFWGVLGTVSVSQNVHILGIPALE